MKESKIEKYLVDRVKALGGKAIKMIPTYENGIPDRLVLLYGKPHFIEMKKASEKPAPLQVAYLHELEKMGFYTAIIDSTHGVDIFLRLAKESHDKTYGSDNAYPERARAFARDPSRESESPPTFCKTAEDGVHDTRLRKSLGVYVSYCVLCGRHFA